MKSYTIPIKNIAKRRAWLSQGNLRLLLNISLKKRIKMDKDYQLRKEIQETISGIKTAKDIFSLFKKLNYPEKVVFDISSK
ncbi:MAG: hypothetical protein QXL47_03400, partial [Candidatus Anstonellales archaeon]